MDDAQDDRFRQHEAWMSSFALMLEAQHAMNQRQVDINAGVQATLARIETLLARMLRQDTNGTDA